jgi:hypothetical protein
MVQAHCVMGAFLQDSAQVVPIRQAGIVRQSGVFGGHLVSPVAKLGLLI